MRLVSAGMMDAQEPASGASREDAQPQEGGGAGAIFVTTRWSVVLAAGDQHSPVATAALERLCQTYWYPLYAYVRRRGYSEHDAEDLTQGFFAHLLERHSFGRVAPAKGKFRSFLLASLNYFLGDQYDRASALKRGGGQTGISFEAERAAERFNFEPVDGSSPDTLFERRWALTLLEQVMARLKAEYTSAEKSEQFEKLSGYLIHNAGGGTYAEAARELGQNENWVKKMVQRMRERYYALFRAEIGDTVESEGDIDEELRYLCEVMARR
jgi:RNA polymerase sigma factor (sigma-70 family)